MLIWTQGYSPWILGGDVHAPVGAEIAVGECYDLGGGFKGYLVASPLTGETYVAEATTGAIVGSSLKEVRADISAADADTMTRQVEEAAEQVKRVRVEPAKEFWARQRR